MPFSDCIIEVVKTSYDLFENALQPTLSQFHVFALGQSPSIFLTSQSTIGKYISHPYHDPLVKSYKLSYIL